MDAEASDLATGACCRRGSRWLVLHSYRDAHLDRRVSALQRVECGGADRFQSRLNPSCLIHRAATPLLVLMVTAGRSTVAPEPFPSGG